MSTSTHPEAANIYSTLPPLNPHLDTTSQDVRVMVTTNDDGDFIRTAVRLDSDNGASIIILNRDGYRVCMLNIFDFGETYDVDVIPIGTRNALEARSMKNGRWVMEATAPIGSLVAVIGKVGVLPPKFIPFQVRGRFVVDPAGGFRDGWNAIDNLDDSCLNFPTRKEAEDAAKFARAYVKRWGDIDFNSFPHDIDQALHYSEATERSWPKTPTLK